MSELSGVELHTSLLRALGWRISPVDSGLFWHPDRDSLHRGKWLKVARLADLNGMGIILAEMRRRGWWPMMKVRHSDREWWCQMHDAEKFAFFEAADDDLPTAVERAALAALESER